MRKAEQLNNHFTFLVLMAVSEILCNNWNDKKEIEKKAAFSGL